MRSGPADGDVRHRRCSTQQLKARDKAFRAANYYLKKTGSTRHGVPMLAEAGARASPAVPRLAGPGIGATI